MQHNFSSRPWSFLSSG